MTAEKTTKAFGWRVYGLGVIALGAVCLVFGSPWAEAHIKA